MAAAAATLITACQKSAVTPPAEETTISVSLALAGAPETRKEEPAGATNQIDPQLTNGYIFILEGEQIIYREPLTTLTLGANPATSVGQTSTQIVGEGLTPGDAKLFPLSSTVYVLVNYPASIGDPTRFGTFTELKAATTTIDYNAGVNTTYTVPAMANVGGVAAVLVENGVNGDDIPQAEAVIDIAPLYARVEIGGMMIDGTTKGGLKGGNLVKSFDLVGVYMDNYYRTFDMGGALVSSSLQDNNQDKTIGSKVATGWFGDYFPGSDALEWDETSAADPLTPTGGNVWANHIAGGNIPRIIFEITDLEAYEDANGNGKRDQGEDTPADFTSDPKNFITVKSFVDATGKTITSFERGKIYKIRSLTFQPSQATELPNEKDAQITAVVNVVDWVLEEAIPVI